MAERPIREADHVVRHCPRNRTIRENGIVVGVQPRTFALRSEVGEDYLSASYWEYFDGTEAQKAVASAKALPRAFSKDDYLVKLNVGELKSLGAKHSMSIRVLHVSNHPINPAYAKIKGTPPNGEHAMIADLAQPSICKLIKP